MAKMVTHLKDNGVWENTLLIVANDNDADWKYSDNSQLLGSKFTLWTGGVPAFITGGYLSEGKKGEIFGKDRNDKSL